jgi:hypothetical protein
VPYFNKAEASNPSRMNTRTITRIAAVALSLTLVAAAVWYFGQAHTAKPPAKAPPVAVKPAQPAVVVSPVVETPPAAVAKPLAPQQAEEVAATARMYLAHAPLRTPEVADPNSPANKQILQTMVLKALAQPAHAPLAAATNK